MREALGGLFDLRFDQFGGRERVSTGRYGNGHASTGVGIHPTDRRIAFRPQFDAGHVGKADGRAAGIGFEDDRLELIGRLQTRLGRDGGVEHLRGRLRLSADFACGDFGILVGDGRNHIGGDQRKARQLVRIEPDAHGILGTEYVDVAYARRSGESILQVRDKVIGHVLIGAAVRLIIDSDDHQEVGIGLGDAQALLLHLLGQTGKRLLNLILHLHLSDVRVGAFIECCADSDRSARAGRRTEIEQAVDAR